MLAVLWYQYASFSIERIGLTSNASCVSVKVVPSTGPIVWVKEVDAIGETSEVIFEKVEFRVGIGASQK